MRFFISILFFFAITDLFGSRFGPEHLLGKGTTADVFLVEDAKLQRYALKLSHRDSLEQEFRTGEILRHPVIIQVYEKGKVDGHNYIVTEYVEGVGFDAVSSQTLTKNEVDQVISDLFSALIFSCKNGYIHTDLWPKNFLLDKKKNLRVIDLGSFDLLSEKVLGRFSSYQKALVQLVEIFLEASDHPDKRKLLYALKTAKTKNCFVTKKNQAVLVENLLILQNSLAFYEGAE